MPTPQSTPRASVWPDFDAAMRVLHPDLDPRAIVYEVDSGELDAANTRLVAGVVIGDKILFDTVREKTVAKLWLRDFCLKHQADRAAVS